ncbi:DUF2931 family protein [Pseudomonas sp. Ant30-3]|uniref:DUF2931 family protein n=1 Tax=Pseudomonas sp. Ant30-3 TaxID=1488328 RepID=UPI00048C7EBD|nr:DUF2931 family protein [Pseudomonas sp. Ant30-3]
MRVVVILLAALIATGCQATVESGSQVNPSTAQWSLSFNEPFFMKAWVEDSAVEDINGKVFHRTGGGRASGGEPENGTESARGWGENVTGSIREVVGADLPKRIYVRWQSIVEPQTYRAWVDIPEEARQIMQASVTQLCPSSPQNGLNSLALVYVGLAPGGIVEVRVADACMKSIKVARAQAEIEPLGPDQGKSQGQYAYPVSEKAKRYIEKYGIPYGSW